MIGKLIILHYNIHELNKLYLKQVRFGGLDFDEEKIRDFTNVFYDDYIFVKLYEKG
jgi:hypothetical protein